MGRVLLVDDEPAVLFTLREVLADRGHEPITAASGREALTRLEGAEAVVTDLAMPGMSGLELLPIMRDMDGCEDLPAIFLSGRVEHADVEAGRALNATYLTKPFSAIALCKAVERLSPVEAGW